jgi:hypothetical protein
MIYNIHTAQRNASPRQGVDDHLLPLWKNINFPTNASQIISHGSLEKLSIRQALGACADHKSLQLRRVCSSIDSRKSRK